MNRVVHHYAVTDTPTRHMVPGGSKIVTALMRQGQPAVYVEKPAGEEVSPPEVPMMIVVVGTGQQFTAWGLHHIASLNDGALVWHIYGSIDHG